MTLAKVNLFNVTQTSRSQLCAAKHAYRLAWRAPGGCQSMCIAYVIAGNPWGATKSARAALMPAMAFAPLLVAKNMIDCAQSLQFLRFTPTPRHPHRLKPILGVLQSDVGVASTRCHHRHSVCLVVLVGTQTCTTIVYGCSVDATPKS